jgi:hypothetical protein
MTQDDSTNTIDTILESYKVITSEFKAVYGKITEDRVIANRDDYISNLRSYLMAKDDKFEDASIDVLLLEREKYPQFDNYREKHGALDGNTILAQYDNTIKTIKDVREKINVLYNSEHKDTFSLEIYQMVLDGIIDKCDKILN